MSTSNGLKGWNTQDFMPSTGQTRPDYNGVPAGDMVVGTVDGDGHVETRSAVLTDEGSFRETFATLPTNWIFSPLAAGQYRSATDSVLIQRLALAPAAGDLIYGSVEVDYMPLVANCLMGRPTLTTATPPLTIADAFNLQGIGGSTIEGFIGLYAEDIVANPNLDPTHPTAQAEYIEWVWTAAQTQLLCDFRAASHAGSGGQQTIPNATVINRNAVNWRTLSLDGENALFRDNATITAALPPATTRGTISGKIPDIYTPLFFSVGIRAGAAPGVPGAQAQIQMDALYMKNLNRVVVNTTF